MILMIAITVNIYIMLRDSITEVIHQFKKIVYQKKNGKILRNAGNEISTQTLAIMPMIEE
jgi:ACR3 family arsenite efflux pump ArsB